MPHATVWDEVLAYMRAGLDSEEFRRWFGDSSYASDVGDQITVWVPSEAIRRHLTNNFDNDIQAALKTIGRGGTIIRFVVAGYDEDEDDEEKLT
jgi:chromosomal replication initiation ATPase DnaA